MDGTTAFLSRLREAITRSGLTQAELAHRLGVREATVSDWFRRGVVPSGQTMLRFPDLLGEDGHWLLTGRRREVEEEAASARRGGPLSPEERVRVRELLEDALRVLRDGGAPYLQVREAAEGERRVLDAVRAHGREKKAPPREQRKSG